MRIQLDSAVTGAESVRPGEIEQSAGASGPGAGSRRTGSGVSGAQDSIQISSASSALNRLNCDRAARIQQLAASVQNGSYNVSSSLISGAILNYAAGGPSGAK